MLALDYLVERVMTPAAVNANIIALNQQYAGLVGYKAVPTLKDPGGVLNMWTKAWSDMRRPSIGYEVGFSRDGITEIVLQGKNRDILPLWVSYVSEATEELDARRQCEVTWEALRMTLDIPTPDGLEGQLLPNVNPVRGVVQIGPSVNLELVTVDVEGSGKVLGFRSRWQVVLDTVRS